jgi:hypothetical protein
MTDALIALGPILAFMMIPIWIPLIVVISGFVADVARPREMHPIAAQRHARQAAAAALQPALQPV